jgi:hypothetical protein
MIAALLLSGLAAAGISKDIYECTGDDIRPIWGTSGFANTTEALRTNANTWSATHFAEANLLDVIEQAAEDDENVGAFAYEMNFIYGVTDLPVYSTDAYGEGGCPAAYRLASRAIDMQAHNLGVAFNAGPFGGFYASSVTFGAPAMDPFNRAMTWSMGAPIYSIVPLMAAPLVGSWQNAVGASAYAQEYIFGLNLDTNPAHFHVGYTKTRGLYASAFEKRIGLFASVVARDKLATLGQAEAGVRGFSPLAAAGATSLFARALPLSEASDQGGEPGVIEQLLTGHVEQVDIAGRFDLRLAYAVEPQAQLHQALVAVHSQEFRGAGGVLLQGGMVSIPRQTWYGTQGGAFPSLRLEGRGTILEEEDFSYSMAGLIMVNDPEQIALYPFATNAVSARISIDMRF